MQNKFYAGSRSLTCVDAEHQLSFPVLVHYPTYVASTPVAFGPYEMDVAVDAPVAEASSGLFPLVIISHGNSGSHLLYRTISVHLAQQGYIVAMPEHYGNNRNNNSLENTITNLQYRPLHISYTIDLLLGIDLGQRINHEAIAVIGHSMGGYTALCLAGCTPWSLAGERIQVSSDNRVKALVLLAPAAGWFRHPANKLSIPTLVYVAEHDPVTPVWNADVVANLSTQKDLVTVKVVGGAGHFSFLSPFPEALRKPGFMPATDPEGFNREAFHDLMSLEIQQFLADGLGSGSSLKQLNEIE